jgi:hypothetical protein
MVEIAMVRSKNIVLSIASMTRIVRQQRSFSSRDTRAAAVSHSNSLLIASLNRPGGNVTGVSLQTVEPILMRLFPIVRGARVNL